jgi:hypothetical protein
MLTNAKTLSLLLAALVTSPAPGPDQAPTAGHTEPMALSCSAEPPPVLEEGGCGEAAPVAPVRPASLSRGRVFHQIRYHLSLPASRPRILDSLAATAELAPDEAVWIAAALPRRTFASGAEVLVALFPDAPAEVLARVDPSGHHAVSMNAADPEALRQGLAQW